MDFIKRHLQNKLTLHFIFWLFFFLVFHHIVSEDLSLEYNMINFCIVFSFYSIYTLLAVINIRFLIPHFFENKKVVTYLLLLILLLPVAFSCA